MKIIPQHNSIIIQNIFNNLIEHFDKRYPESTFFYKNGDIFFELDKKTNTLYCSYENVWKKISIESPLVEYTEKQEVINIFIQRFTNLESVTPSMETWVTHDWWDSIQIRKKLQIYDVQN